MLLLLTLLLQLLLLTLLLQLLLLLTLLLQLLLLTLLLQLLLLLTLLLQLLLLLLLQLLLLLTLLLLLLQLLLALLLQLLLLLLTLLLQLLLLQLALLLLLLQLLLALLLQELLLLLALLRGSQLLTAREPLLAREHLPRPLLALDARLARQALLLLRETLLERTLLTWQSLLSWQTALLRRQALLRWTLLAGKAALLRQALLRHQTLLGRPLLARDNLLLAGETALLWQTRPLLREALLRAEVGGSIHRRCARHAWCSAAVGNADRPGARRRGNRRNEGRRRVRNALGIAAAVQDHARRYAGRERSGNGDIGIDDIATRGKRLHRLNDIAGTAQPLRFLRTIGRQEVGIVRIVCRRRRRTPEVWGRRRVEFGTRDFHRLIVTGTAALEIYNLFLRRWRQIVIDRWREVRRRRSLRAEPRETTTRIDGMGSVRITLQIAPIGVRSVLLDCALPGNGFAARSCKTTYVWSIRRIRECLQEFRVRGQCVTPESSVIGFCRRQLTQRTGAHVAHLLRGHNRRRCACCPFEEREGIVDIRGVPRDLRAPRKLGHTDTDAIEHVLERKASFAHDLAEGLCIGAIGTLRGLCDSGGLGIERDKHVLVGFHDGKTGRERLAFASKRTLIGQIKHHNVDVVRHG